MSDNSEFIKRMLGHINNSSVYYPIRNAFGTTVQNCPINAVLAYSKLSKTKSDTYQNIEFLVAGLCYNSIKPNTGTRTTYVRFEDVLKRIDREDEIANFIKIRYDNTGYFAKRFVTIAMKAINKLNPNEHFDYNQLIEDLKHWNYNSVKMRWAMAITNMED